MSTMPPPFTRKNVKGRPPIHGKGKTMRSYPVFLTDEQAYFFENFGSGNIPQGVRRAADLIQEEFCNVPKFREREAGEGGEQAREAA